MLQTTGDHQLCETYSNGIIKIDPRTCKIQTLLIVRAATGAKQQIDDYERRKDNLAEEMGLIEI